MVCNVNRYAYVIDKLSSSRIDDVADKNNYHTEIPQSKVRAVLKAHQ